ncbi:MAG: peptide ABC transporter substrate-binding protein [Anaerolineae bacterium]|nr:peptide ABC transporter substrate-binding protein [Anaerolineae bacterium]
MSRGNRWQWVVLLASVALLVVTAVTRKPVTQEAAPTPSPTSTPVAPQRQGPPFFTEALVGEVRKLNPLLASANPVDRDITSLIFEGLTASDDYGQIVPALADHWTVSRDATIFTFYLRDDVLWQDGVPFTGADVAFTLALLRTPGFGADVPGLEQLAEFWRTVEVEVLDDYTLRFRLTQPLAAFPDFLRLGILPQHALDGAPPGALLTHPFNLAPVGTGPYQLEYLRADGDRIAAVQLRRAPTYAMRADARPYRLERIVFNLYASMDAALAAFDAGEVNAVGGVPLDAEDAPGMVLYTALEPVTGFLLFNHTREEVAFFQNRRFRSALAYGLDSRSLVREHLGGSVIAAASALIPGSWAWSPEVDWPPYDVETAKVLLERARVELPVAFTLLCLNTPEMVALAEGIAAQWAMLDITVTVEAVDAPALLSRVTTRQFDAAIVELSMAGMADPDPYVFWHQGQVTGGQNYGGVDDGPISEALEQARRDPNGVNRATWYKRFQARFADRAPAIPLYYPVYAYGLDERVSGVQLGMLSDPGDRFRSLWMWTYDAP